MSGFDMTKLAGQLNQIQGVLQKIRVEGNSNGGGLKVVLNGQQDVLAVRIMPPLLAPANKSRLETELLMAFNQGLKKSKERATREINQLVGIDISQLNQFF
ncbi:YbaB/EbfC family nucleoid-associated protein [Peptococcaceae bacterium 1198_IL3148]